MKTLQIAEQIIENSIFDDLFFAGQETYSYFWSRDFLYCSEYLIRSNHYRPKVFNCIKKLLSYKKNGLLPKCLDTRSSTVHIVYNSYLTYRGKENKPIKHKPDKDGNYIWKPMYRDHNRSIAIDTNLLFIKACMELNQYEEYREFVYTIKDELIDLLMFYSKNGYINNYSNHLIEQPAFSDWKDSLKRKGISFITNLLYWKVVREMERSRLFENLPRSGNIRYNIETLFYQNGIYSSMKDLKNSFGLDENLLAIDWGFVSGSRADTLFLELVQRKEFEKVPGLAISPENSWYDKPIYAHIAGSGGYHDRCCWLWIIALSAKLAYKFDYTNEAERLKQVIEATVERDQTIYDAYSINRETNELERFTTRGFRAESEWLWGAVYIRELFKLEPKVVEY